MCRGRIFFCSVFALAVVLLPESGVALDMPHYNLDSLTYMSTDIVVADISIRKERTFTATVIQSLYGNIPEGERLETLSDFLQFFCPMEDRQRIILFLDRRPHQISFLFPEAAKSPFVVPPSGVYLIDEYQHVHEYYQQNNPGPYEAQGYHCFVGRSNPTKEQDLDLPSFAEMQVRISESLEKVQPFRRLLDKSATRDDVPRLLTLRKSRPSFGDLCANGQKDAILERISSQLRSLNDPELLLIVDPIGVLDAVEFVTRPDGNSDGKYTAARVRYLIETFSNKSIDLQPRVTSAEILLNLSKFHAASTRSPEKPPSDNPWLASVVVEILRKATAIFVSRSENPQLRALCLQLLPADDAATQATIRKVYSEEKSQELRFAIEQQFLDLGDEVYQSLNPPGGPAASIVRRRTERDCFTSSSGNIAFIATYQQRKDWYRYVIDGSLTQSFVLTNLHTGQRTTIGRTRPMWSSGAKGEDWTEMNQPTGLATGKYVLAFEFSRAGQVVSSGYKLRLAVKKTSAGRRLTLMSRSISDSRTRKRTTFYRQISETN